LFEFVGRMLGKAVYEVHIVVLNYTFFLKLHSFKIIDFVTLLIDI